MISTTSRSASSSASISGRADAVDAAAHNLELLGYVGLADTARAVIGWSPVISTTSRSASSSASISGRADARAIARQLGLPADARVVTGAELAGLDEDG
ncbi:hypothetical protein MAHJHV59_47750 [Mycobacterium avium subsp. hominissuis]